MPVILFILSKVWIKIVFFCFQYLSFMIFGNRNFNVLTLLSLYFISSCTLYRPLKRMAINKQLPENMK